MLRGDVAQLAQHQKDAQAGRKKKEQVEGCLGIARPVERETGLQNDLDVEMLPFGVESRQILLRYRIGERLNGKSTLQRQLIVCLQLDRFRPFRPGDLEFSLLDFVTIGLGLRPKAGESRRR